MGRNKSLEVLSSIKLTYDGISLSFSPPAVFILLLGSSKSGRGVISVIIDASKRRGNKCHRAVPSPPKKSVLLYDNFKNKYSFK